MPRKIKLIDFFFILIEHLIKIISPKLYNNIDFIIIIRLFFSVDKINYICI